MLPGNTAEEKYLWYLTLQGVTTKYGNKPDQGIIDRIKAEMDIIVGNKFTDYILIIWDIHNFCRTPSRVKEFCERCGIEPPDGYIVPIGPGRGSVGGSMVCYCIDIHECDPIKFGLYFERFLNPERIAYPDIDFDISQKYRHIVLEYISNTYGHDHVAQIITYSTLSANSVNEEVLKSACVPLAAINSLKEHIPDEPTIVMKDLLDNEHYMKALRSIQFPDVKVQINRNNVGKIFTNLGDRVKLLDNNDRNILTSVANGMIQQGDIVIKSTWTHDKALHIMQRLEKLNKHESIHAAGVVIAPVILEENVPLMRKSGTGALACQYDMKSVEELGYLKMDALGLRTVDVNADTERLVRKWYDPEFSVSSMRYDDQNAINLIKKGDTIGIFQIESSGFTSMMQEIFKADEWNSQPDKSEIDDFMWISAGLAMYRPGPLDAVIEGKTMVQHLIDRKAGKEPTIYLFPEEERYLKETFGVMVYQEQVMSRVRQMTGCTMGRADILRKAMGKKDPVLMKEQMDWFETEASKHIFSDAPLSEQSRTGIIRRAKEEIEKFARYGFNKAHTVEYGHICYRNAYFKANYPIAFYTSLLNSEMDNAKRQAVIIRDMMRHDIKLLPPLINESGIQFTMTDKDTIRFGLGAIKGLGEKTLQYLIAERDKNGSFKSLEEFRIRIPGTVVNVTALTNLVKCGAFDNLIQNSKKPIQNRATMVETVASINEVITKLKRKPGKKADVPDINIILRNLEAGMINYTVTNVTEDPIEYANWEKQILNYFISAHPIDAYRDEIARWTAIDDVEMEQLPEEFYIAGFVGTVHETVIKKEGRNKGKKMGFVTIETESMAYELTLFPGVYETCLPYTKAGNPVVAKCKRSYFKDKVTIQGVYIRNMLNSGIRDCPECHIRLNESNMFQLIELKQMIDQHPGMTQMFIHYTSGVHEITMVCNQMIALNDRIINYCNQIGKIAYKPI